MLGWIVRSTGARVRILHLDRDDPQVVCDAAGGTVVYTRTNGLWTGYSLTPSPTLDLDYNDPASRLLLWAYLGDRLRGDSRGTIVVSGVAITEHAGLISYYDLQAGPTEEARVYATLAWLSRGARPVRRAPRKQN